MRFASVFAGVGGFDLAFEREGMTPTCQVEKQPHRLAILAEHWPDVERTDDVCTTSGTDLGHPDLVCGGFPCQDTSIAAPHRAGLAGDRSSLFFEFRRLLDEHLRLVDSTRPRWVVIENPPGLLGSNDGRDMAAVALGLEELGYGWAYRVVDSRHLGSAQRRQRVLIVGHRGGDARPAWQVLGDTGPGNQTGGTRPISGGQGGLTAVDDTSGDDSEALIWRKSARPRKALSKGGYETWVPATFANTLTGFDAGVATRQTHLLKQHGRIRTLTVTEWERLQGFPDGWTATAPESSRMAALGDAMNVPMASWLARRLVSVDTSLPLIGVTL